MWICAEGMCVSKDRSRCNSRLKNWRTMSNDDDDRPSMTRTPIFVNAQTRSLRPSRLMKKVSSHDESSAYITTSDVAHYSRLSLAVLENNQQPSDWIIMQW